MSRQSRPESRASTEKRTMTHIVAGLFNEDCTADRVVSIWFRNSASPGADLGSGSGCHEWRGSRLITGRRQNSACPRRRATLARTDSASLRRGSSARCGCRRASGKRPWPACRGSGRLAQGPPHRSRSSLPWACIACGCTRSAGAGIGRKVALRSAGSSCWAADIYPRVKP
jgi:hypothetical protein